MSSFSSQPRKKPILFRAKLDSALSGLRSQPPKTVGIPTLREASSEFVHEMARCRRYEHPFAILVLGLDTNSSNGQRIAEHAERGGWDVDTLPDPQLLSMFLGPILRDSLRSSDVLAQLAVAGRYVILLTEADEMRVGLAVRRLQELIAERIPLPLQVGVALFPRDGLTIEDLVNLANASIESSVASRFDAASGAEN